jgi:hypothetical protein
LLVGLVAFSGPQARSSGARLISGRMRELGNPTISNAPTSWSPSAQDLDLVALGEVLPDPRLGEEVFVGSRGGRGIRLDQAGGEVTAGGRIGEEVTVVLEDYRDCFFLTFGALAPLCKETIILLALPIALLYGLSLLAI